MEAFAWASDDDDALDVFVFDEVFGEEGEAVDGPALGIPCGGGGEDGVGFGVFDDDLGELGLSGIEGDIGVGDIGASSSGKSEHTVYRVHSFGGFDALVVEDPSELLRVFEPEPEFGSGGAGEESGAGESLAIEDHVVVVFAEFFEPFDERTEAEVAALLSELDAFEGDDFVEGGMMLDRLGVGVADHPVDFGIWVASFERGEDGGGTADVTQRAWADDEDSFWVGVGSHAGR